MVTLCADASTLVPALFVGTALSALPEHPTLGSPSGTTTDVSQPSNYLLSKA